MFLSIFIQFWCDFLSLFGKRLSKDFHVRVARFETHFLSHIFAPFWAIFSRLAGARFRQFSWHSAGPFRRRFGNFFGSFLGYFCGGFLFASLHGACVFFVPVLRHMPGSLPQCDMCRATGHRTVAPCWWWAVAPAAVVTLAAHGAAGDNRGRAGGCGDPAVGARVFLPVFPPSRTLLADVLPSAIAQCPCAYRRILRPLRNASGF
jgi:hypothetical protein